MRIGIDARFYGSFGKGLGRYTQKLIEHLEIIDHENQYFIFLRKENYATYQPKSNNFHKVLADYRWYTAKEQLLMPCKAWRLRLDCMHFTHFNVPLLYYRKFIVTIHDLILAKYPTQRATKLGPLTYSLKHFAYRLVIKSAVKRAKAVIAVSEYTKKEIIRYFHCAPEKVMVTYEAAEPVPETFSPDPQVLQKYDIRRPYVLYIGNVYPHKNIEGLLRAFKKVLKTHPDYYLVLVGKEDYFFKRIKEETQDLQIENRVLFPGFVTDRDLPHLYALAAAYVFPSFCEGFGLPALEACSYGVPVAASNNSCLPEILGEAGIFFDPNDLGAMEGKIRKIIEDQKLANTLRQRGYARVRQFSWKKMAEITKKVYNKT